MIAAGKPDPLSETSTFVLLQQQTSVLSQQHVSTEDGTAASVWPAAVTSSVETG